MKIRGHFCGLRSDAVLSVLSALCRRYYCTGPRQLALLHQLVCWRQHTGAIGWSEAEGGGATGDGGDGLGARGAAVGAAVGEAHLVHLAQLCQLALKLRHDLCESGPAWRGGGGRPAGRQRVSQYALQMASVQVPAWLLTTQPPSAGPPTCLPAPRPSRPP